MSLVPVKDLLEKAEAGGYAVGAFNCNNMEIVQAIIAAAEAENAPVILQASQGAIKYAGIDYIGHGPSGGRKSPRARWLCTGSRHELRTGNSMHTRRVFLGDD